MSQFNPFAKTGGGGGGGGADGKDGRGIVSIEKTNTVGLVDTYTTYYTDGTETEFYITNGATGATGPQGPQGLKGEPGEAGPQGLNGEDGDSAYQIWLDEGNIGTEQDFLNSLKADKNEVEVTTTSIYPEDENVELWINLGNKEKIYIPEIDDNAVDSQVNTYSVKKINEELNNKVDKVSGMGLSQNSFTNAYKTKLDGIDTGATKTVVDAALSSTSTNPVQNNVVQAPISRIVDAGAKNLLKITATSQTIRGVNFTVNDDGTVTVDGTNDTSSSAVFYLNILPADTAPNYNGCRLTGCPQGGGTSTYRLSVQLNSSSFTVYASDIGGGSTIHDVPSADCRVAIVVYPGATVNNLIFKPMICTAEDYAISSEFVPYAKSNYELTQATEPISRLVDAGTKNIFKMRDPVTVSTNGITFVINTDGTIDVSTDDNGATVQTDLTIGEITTENGVNYVWSGCPLGGSSTTYRLMISTSVYDEGSGYAYTSLIDGTRRPFIRVFPGTVIASPVKFYPMLCTAKDYLISPEFVPYAPSNRELYEEVETKADILPADRRASDINTAVDPGMYRFYGNGQTTNLPSDITVTSPFGLLEVCVCGPYIKQVLTHFVSGSPAVPPTVYIRRSSDSGTTWGPWEKFVGTAVT